MSTGCFVTGTDTGCGKTLVALALLHGLGARGMQVRGMKPIAAGADWIDGELRNDDAESLLAASCGTPAYSDVNPYLFEPAIAPHIAAGDVGVSIDPEHILAARDRLLADCDGLVVEGAGGWRVPLGNVADIGALVGILGYPVVLVVGMRLGCLNHALLTAEAIARDGVELAGWVANVLDSTMPRVAENVATLTRILPAPLLGTLEFMSAPDPAVMAASLNLEPVADRCFQTRNGVV